MAFIVKRRTRADYDAITNKNPNIVYFVAEGTTLVNATHYSLYVGDKLVAEEVDFGGYAKEDFVTAQITNHNTSGSAHTDIRNLISTLNTELETLQGLVEALEGAYIYRGTITTSGANPTPAELNARITALLDRAPQLGDVLVTEDTNPEYDKNEWYFNGTIWNNLGQFIISQATTTVAGIVKLGSNTTIGSLNGNNVITENVLKTIVNTQLLRKDVDNYVKTVNGQVGDVIINGLNILMDGEIAGKQLQSVSESVYASSSNKVNLPYGSNLNAENHNVGDVIRIQITPHNSQWIDADPQYWGDFKDNQDNPLDTYISDYHGSIQSPQAFQNSLRNYANLNYPPENMEPYWFIHGVRERNWYLASVYEYNEGAPKVFEYYDEYIPDSNWINYVRDNYPISEYPDGAVGKGGDNTPGGSTYYAILREETYYVMTVGTPAEYQYYKVISVSTPDERAVSEAIYEAEGKITDLENALNWDD